MSTLPGLSVVDLFSGCGGLSLGFQEEGFDIVFAAENNEPAFETYTRNLGDHCRLLSVNPEVELPPTSVVIGGPPCQGFSSAGQRKPGDARNSLVKVFAEIVARMRPRAFVMENVEGFLTAEKGARVFELLEMVIGAGYRVHLRKVNFANYGVPQHRKRIIVIGGLGWDPVFPGPTSWAFGAPGTERNYVDLPPCPTLADALESLPAATSDPDNFPTDHVWKSPYGSDIPRVRQLKPGQTMRDLPEEFWHSTYRKRAFRRVMDGMPTEKRGGAPAGIRRLSFGEPSKAITSGAIREFVHPVEDRYLTLRECARIQTFPDSFTFAGNQAQRALQIGNAVPPRLAALIARFLKTDLLADHEDGAQPGTLLSFVPTLANGMSPALERISNLIHAEFASKNHYARQGTLWH
ncbi:MAG: DNA cytosine methyltransferase [Proteobacteria bacterium]|nr:DNA cytosine methyltransferase [Pseudomonadota bacterium]